jgi:hypothetical protein
MFDSLEDEWQHDIHHPSTRALLGFLETDIEGGMRLISDARIEREAGHVVPQALVHEMEAGYAEIDRWLTRARERHVALGGLALRIIQFLGEVDTIRRDRQAVQ